MPGQSTIGRKFFVQTALAPVGLGALLFAPAGRLTWLNGWICLIAFSVAAGAVAAYVMRVNRRLLAARAQKFQYERSWDRIWVAAYAPCPLVMLVVAGLDAGRGESSWGPAAVGIGLAGMLSGIALVGWAMAVNATLFTTVRIAGDGSQPVVSRGPYAVVRHPYYVGLMMIFLSVPAVLGSALAYIPAGLACLLVIIRAGLEDSALQQELPGYRSYATRVRGRLVPGVW